MTYQRAAALHPKEWTRLKELEAITLIQHAEFQSANGRWKESLDSFAQAYLLPLDTSLRERVSHSYMRSFSSLVADQVESACEKNGWDSITVMPFEAETASQGRSICLSVASKLSSSPSLSVSVGNPKKNYPVVKRDCRIVGEYREFLVARLLAPQCEKAIMLASVRNIVTLPVRPIFRIWDKLDISNGAGDRFRVSVWTDKKEYCEGESLRIWISSTEDCYLTLVDLQTSGKMYVLFPNDFIRNGFIRAGQTYSIPAHSDGYEIVASGPNGVEGLRAIGTKSPLSTVPLAVGQVFKCYDSSEEQQVQIEQMIAEIAKMNTDNWDIAEWTFSIKNR